jgi:glutamate-ammonia-ligase adenylyltransferase
MQDRTWPNAVEACADPARVRHVLAALADCEAASELRPAAPEAARILAALLSGSKVLGELLLAHPDWVGPLLDPAALRVPRGKADLARRLRQLIEPARSRRDIHGAFAALRRFKQREILRIAARDLARLSHAVEITRELSDLADLCLATTYELCRAQLADRLGEPWHRDAADQWLPTPFCVLGMGKLGGQELNYSSDVDVLFVYAEEGHVFRTPPQPGDPGKGLSNHQFFKRLAEAFVAEVGQLTPDGTLYRIDLRLRPEGKAGPLARSLSSYESYYWQWGQTWERMMLIKARRVAGDAALAGEFIEMVQPFRYPRSIAQQALDDIAGMKDRIEQEVVRAGEVGRNVKLGRGGIREIEFVAQTLQIMNAGRHPFLAHAQTLPALDKLVEYRILAPEHARTLAQAYVFLRDVEHRLQMENGLQTHTLPAERQPRERLARLMGFPALGEFEAALAIHREGVRAIYSSLLKPETGPRPAPLPSLDPDSDAALPLLAAHGFREPEKALRLARGFVFGPGFGHVTTRTQAFAQDLLARLLAQCPQPPPQSAPPPEDPPDGNPSARTLSDPDRVLARLDSFVQAYGGRALLFETWTANPSLFDLLVLLFDRSEFLAETAIRTPDLVDELELSGFLRRAKTADQTLRDLRHGRDDKDQRLWLRRYHQTELMRIGLRDILGLADYEQNLVEITALAEACLQYAIEIALRRQNLPATALAIIGLGKLGGAELNYGSDLDLVFVADNRVAQLPDLQRVAVEVLDLLASPTELGVAFRIDARLRPDGEKGLLVNTLKSYEEYYRTRARLWELQALSRCRPIAGPPALGERFLRFAGALVDLRQPAAAAARNPAWRQEIDQMRLRIERERTPKGKEHLALKTGAGGLIDAEFIAQALCLAHGWLEPNTLRALERARTFNAIDSADAESLIANYRCLRRIEAILRRWSYEGETELPDDPAPLYRVAVRCGFTRAEPFMAAVRRYRQAIRAVYRKVFPPGAPSTGS